MSGKGKAAVLTVAAVAAELERIAPLRLAEETDNVGLVIGDGGQPARKLVLAIDLTEAVVAEAARGGAGMVMAYHPPIYRPIARLVSPSPAYLAARAGLAVYSMHTALDAAQGGTNDVMAEAIGLELVRPLAPVVRRDQHKIVVYTPPGDVERVMSAAFAAGAGHIGQYSQCSFRASGTGTFLPESGAHPAVGQVGRREEVQEQRLEFICWGRLLPRVLAAVVEAHSYEVPAIDVFPLEDRPAGTGMGRIGQLKKPLSTAALVARVKRGLGLARVQVILPDRAGAVRNVAVGAGSCGELFRQARAAGAEAYVTGELRHHDALAARAAGLTVICVGHGNSERPALRAVADRLAYALPELPVAISRADRDPLEIV